MARIFSEIAISVADIFEFVADRGRSTCNRASNAEACTSGPWRWIQRKTALITRSTEHDSVVDTETEDPKDDEEEVDEENLGSAYSKRESAPRMSHPTC